MSDKHAKFPECIPVSQRKISLNIDDLPDLQPYSRVSSKAYERYDRTEDIFRGGRLGSHKPDRERSWIADKLSSANNLRRPEHLVGVHPALLRRRGRQWG